MAKVLIKRIASVTCILLPTVPMAESTAKAYIKAPVKNKDKI